MLYPRITTINGKEVLVGDEQMTGWAEHMLKHRMIFFDSLIGLGTFNKMDMGIVNYLMTLDSMSHDPIKLVITSMGGELNVVFLLYDTIRMLQSPVETFGRLCVSGAAILLAAGGKRYLSPHAKVMLHLPSGTMGGDVRDWEIQHKEMQKYKDKMVDILCECGVKESRSKVLEDIDRDFWLEPEEAIAYGLADGIMSPEIWQSWIKEDK